jgi:hypothetical protein
MPLIDTGPETKECPVPLMGVDMSIAMVQTECL